MPRQEPGTRPSRPVGYDLSVLEREDATRVQATLVNTGELGAHLQARFLTPAAPPASYTVGAGDRLDVAWPATGAYDITLHGPHGIFRRFSGDRPQDHVHTVLRRTGRSGQVRLTVTALQRPATVTLTNAYSPDRPRTVRLEAGREHTFVVDTRGTGGWYDATVTVEGESYARQLAGHLEDGRGSVSDPAFGR